VEVTDSGIWLCVFGSCVSTFRKSLKLDLAHSFETAVNIYQNTRRRMLKENDIYVGNVISRLAGSLVRILPMTRMFCKFFV
jgi:hypothetical protein